MLYIIAASPLSRTSPTNVFIAFSFRDSAQEDRVVEEGGLPSLISMLRLEKSAEKSTEQALVVLRNLSLTSAGNCKRIAAEGGVRPVLSLLQADKEQLQEHALVIVVAMAEAAPDIRYVSSATNLGKLFIS